MTMPRIMVRNSQAQIPTMAKLFAGLVLAATGVLCARGIVPQLPPGVQAANQLPLIMGSFGLLLGWRVVGLRPGRGWRDAVNDGLRGAVYLLIATFVFLGAFEMLRLALRMRYHDVMEAVTDVIGQGATLAVASLGLQPVITLGVGAALAGLAAEWAHRRFGR